MGLKKFLRKAAKIGVKIAKPALQSTPLGGLAVRAQQTFKSLGGNRRAAELGKIEPMSVRAPIARVLPAMAAPKLRKFSGRSTASGSSRKGSKIASAARTATKQGRRVPPPGGLDLRAMAAQWRAAGKPGTWRDWIRTNPVRR